MKETEERTEFSALKHPVFWVALALLVLNDHVFKGGDVLPGWLTGKLSDFAGLIVAPIVLVALLRARTDRRRAFAMFVVVGWFVGANLFAPVAEATSALAAQVGLSWTFWVDSTDLVALAVLPLTWQLISRARPLSRARLAERLALGFGVAACVASPGPGNPTWTTDAFVVNDTDETIDLRVRWVESVVDCDAINTRYAEALPRNTFGAGTVFQVLARATLPLDRDAAETMGRDTRWEVMDAGTGTETAPLTHTGNCDVAMISADGLPETIVFWQGLTPHVIPDVVEDDDDELAVREGLRLQGADGERLTLRNGVGYTQAMPMEVYDGGSTCRDYGAITGFDWSDLPSWAGERIRITAVRPTIDDCVQVSLEGVRRFGSSSEAWDAFICVPPEDFTFLPNSVVQIWNRPNRLRIVRDLRLDDGTSWRTAELIISRGVSSMSEGPFALRLSEVDGSCGGVRMSCGGFRVPAAGGLTEGGGTRFVHPGDIVEREAADGRRARLRVGRAETMWVTHAACGAGRDQLGPRLEALVVYGEEPR